MPVIVKTLAGASHEIEVEPEEKIRNVKTLIQKAEGTNPDDQVLIYAGRQLEDNMTLADYRCDL
jgi:ubiquitin